MDQSIHTQQVVFEATNTVPTAAVYVYVLKLVDIASPTRPTVYVLVLGTVARGS